MQTPQWTPLDKKSQKQLDKAESIIAYFSHTIRVAGAIFFIFFIPIMVYNSYYDRPDNQVTGTLVDSQTQESAYGEFNESFLNGYVYTVSYTYDGKQYSTDYHNDEQLKLGSTMELRLSPEDPAKVTSFYASREHDIRMFLPLFIASIYVIYRYVIKAGIKFMRRCRQ